jgi:peptidoglycan-associated lipoprotein
MPGKASHLFVVLLLISGCSSASQNVNKQNSGVPHTSIESAFFAPNSYALDEAARKTLSKQSEWLRQYPASKILIMGYSDKRETVYHDYVLGELRAAAVKDYFITANIEANRIRIVSCGNAQSGSGGNDAVFTQNRRTETVVEASANVCPP